MTENEKLEKILGIVTDEQAITDSVVVGMHQTHCCIYHGCKYGHAHCPVRTGEVTQDYLCEECDEDDK